MVLQAYFLRVSRLCDVATYIPRILNKNLIQYPNNKNNYDQSISILKNVFFNFSPTNNSI